MPAVICKRVIRAARGLFTDQRGALATFGGPPLCRRYYSMSTRPPISWSRQTSSPAWFPRSGFLLFSAKRSLRRLILGVIGMQGRPLPEQVADEVVQARAMVVCSVILSATRW